MNRSTIIIVVLVLFLAGLGSCLFMHAKKEAPRADVPDIVLHKGSPTVELVAKPLTGIAVLSKQSVMVQKKHHPITQDNAEIILPPDSSAESIDSAVSKTAYVGSIVDSNMTIRITAIPDTGGNLLLNYTGTVNQKIIKQTDTLIETRIVGIDKPWYDNFWCGVAAAVAAIATPIILLKR
jgi:hypothetical protein